MDSQGTWKSAPKRKRGRPSGSNRTPLSLEERRARNAQYERERRCETAEAMLDLAAAVGCMPNIPTADLLATVVNYLQTAARHPAEEIEALQRCNAELETQIHEIEQRLASGAEIEYDDSTVDSFYEDGNFEKQNNSRDRKRMKLDSTEDSWEPMPSPAETQWSQRPNHCTTLEVPISNEETVTIELDSNKTLDHLENWSVEDFIWEYL